MAINPMVYHVFDVIFKETDLHPCLKRYKSDRDDHVAYTMASESGFVLQNSTCDKKTEG